MGVGSINPHKTEKSHDWFGNNAAFICPIPSCGQVYVVSAFLNRNGRGVPSLPLLEGLCCTAQQRLWTGKDRMGADLASSRIMLG